MSSQEVKITLRKIEYPGCAREALVKIGNLLCRRVPSLSQMDLALDLMAEFLFCELDKRGNKLPPLTPIKELQLIDIFYDYFNNENLREVQKNTVFLSLFSGTMAAARSRTLSKLISIAVGIPSKSLLTSASALMQQVGDFSMNYNKLAEAIVKDYFILIPDATQRLANLPECAPQFVANFLTAVAEIYFNDKKGDLLFPPNSLLETVVLWVNGNNKLCIAAQQNPSALPSGTIVMESTTPIAGLLKWCILAPIYNKNSELYAKLHLGLLNNILEIPPGYVPIAINYVHLTIPVPYICKYSSTLLSTKVDEPDKDRCLLEDVSLQLSLDRYAQAVQVALSVNCVYGNISEFLNQLSQLPLNRLWRIVIAANHNK